MADPNQWLITYRNEIAMAENSRAKGNEGRARVCARRAAGAVLGEYFRRANITDPGPSAYARLKSLVDNTEIPEKLRQVSSHFLIKIDYDHNLPIQADLIAEAKWLAKKLLKV
jgi:hypothetical protein